MYSHAVIILLTNVSWRNNNFIIKLRTYGMNIGGNWVTPSGLINWVSESIQIFTIRTINVVPRYMLVIKVAGKLQSSEDNDHSEYPNFYMEILLVISRNMLKLSILSFHYTDSHLRLTE